MEIPRVLRQAPPTRPLALLISQQTTVMSRLTWIAARLWKCGTSLRTRSFILHFMRGLCVVKSSGAVCNREIEHQKKKEEIRFLPRLSFGTNAQPSSHCTFFLFLLSTSECRTVSPGLVSVTWPRPLCVTAAATSLD